MRRLSYNPFAMRRRVGIVLCGLAAACVFDGPPYDATEYRCDVAGRCPDGFACAAGRCVRPGDATDAAIADAAAPPDVAVADGPIVDVPLPPGCDATVDDADARVVYVGPWQLSPAGNPDKYLGSDHYTLGPDASASLSWDGEAGSTVAVRSALADHHGQMGVRVDEGLEALVDLYAAERDDDTVVFQSVPLAAGAHTVTIRWLGIMNPASTGTVIAVDRFDLTAVRCP